MTSRGVTAPPWLTSAPSTNTMVAAIAPVSEKSATTRTGEVVGPSTGETMVTVCAKEDVDASRTKPAAGPGKFSKQPPELSCRCEVMLLWLPKFTKIFSALVRSEERRVGKECK